MKKRTFCAMALTLLMAGTVLTGCQTTDSGSDFSGVLEPGEGSEAISGDDMVAFRPVDCGIQAQEVYEYPFLGLRMTLPGELLAKINSREVFVYNDADYIETYAISYGMLRFSATTEAQRQEEGMSVDLISWEGALEKVGAIGVYEQSLVAQLDQLTGCDTHEKLGESADGGYVYYLSTNSRADDEYAAMLKKAQVTMEEMHAFDASSGYTAFSMDRIDGVETVGTFTAKDIFGETYTEAVFQENDLTLVNVFTTWCSPCVEEMPELEKLRQYYEKENKKVGVVAVVLDVETKSGIDDSALERAKVLYEKSQAKFPFLLPDETNMNGRLVGIESVPESFFVDKNGTIVSEPYVGARSLEDWKTLVDTYLK